MDFNALNIVVATLFVVMAVGFACRKLGVIDDVASKKLSKLILCIGQPAMLIYSLSAAEYNEKNLKTAGIMIVFGFVFHIALAILAYILAIPTRKNVDEGKLTEFSLIFANCAFIGFPIFEALLGPEGVFMASFLIVSFNVLIWTWGIAIMARKRDDIKLTWKKVIFNFGTVPCVIGFVLFLLKNPNIGFEMPDFLSKALQYLQNLCTPISLLVIGALIATQSVKKIFCSWKIYYFNVIKLVILPIIVCLIAKLIMLFVHVPDIELYALFFTAAAALPTASSVTMMAESYGLDSGYSSLAVGTSSLLSVLSLPLTMMIAQWLIAL